MPRRRVLWNPEPEGVGELLAVIRKRRFLDVRRQGHGGLAQLEAEVVEIAFRRRMGAELVDDRRNQTLVEQARNPVDAEACRVYASYTRRTRRLRTRGLRSMPPRVALLHVAVAVRGARQQLMDPCCARWRLPRRDRSAVWPLVFGDHALNCTRIVFGLAPEGSLSFLLPGLMTFRKYHSPTLNLQNSWRLTRSTAGGKAV